MPVKPTSARDRRWIRCVRAQKAYSAAIRRIIERSVALIEKPTPFDYPRGDQRHFLERLERLPDDARDLALRIYYNASLSRFVARRALGQPLDHLLISPPREDGRPPWRLLFELDHGADPPCLVMEETGQVITCLAEGMDGGGDRRTVRELRGWIHDFELWSEQNRSTADKARLEAIERDVVELWYQGWWAPREAVRSLADLGDAGALAMREMLRSECIQACELAADAATEGRAAGDDLRLRRWYDHSGMVAGIAAAMVDGRMLAPGENVIKMMLGPGSIETAMVAGAALARWRPEDGGLIVNPPNWEDAHVWPWGAIPAAIVYWGTLRRLAPRAERDEVRRRVDPELRSVRDESRKETAAGGIRSPVRRMLVPFFADLATLALGEEPDWGEDRVEFPRLLPPPRIEDVCLPGRVSSPLALRRMAQRLLCDAPEELSSIFCTQAELQAWRRRLGDPSEPRPGAFYFPYVDWEPPRIAARPAAGRNDPCPCGSGRKYKKCCLGRETSPDRPQGAGVDDTDAE